MIYILFSHHSYRIIDATIKERERAINGRFILRFKYNSTIEDFNFNDALLGHHSNGDISYLSTETFNIKDTKEIINFIFTDMMVDWWNR